MTEQNNLPAKNNGGTPPAKNLSFTEALSERKPEITKYLAGTEITFEEFLATANTAVSRKPELLRADRRSLILSCLDAAKDGLKPDGKEAALTIYRTNIAKKGEPANWIDKVQYMPMILGIYKRMWNTDQIAKVALDVVREADHFEHTLGADESLDHKRPKLGTPRGSIVGAYSVVTLKSGLRMYEVMDIHEIEEVRAVSRSKDYGPWKDWYGEMAKKTVMRRLSKRLPLSSKQRDLMTRDDDFYEGEFERISEETPQPKIARQPGQSRTIQKLVAQAVRQALPAETKPEPKPEPESAPEPEEEAAPGIQEADDQAPAPQQDEGEPPLNLSLDTADFKSRGKVDWMKWSKAFDKLLAEVRDDAIDMLLSANEKRLETLSMVDDNAMEVVTKALQARGVSLGVSGT